MLKLQYKYGPALKYIPVLCHDETSSDVSCWNDKYIKMLKLYVSVVPFWNYKIMRLDTETSYQCGPVLKLQNSAARFWNYIPVRPNAEIHTSVVPSWNYIPVLCYAEITK